MSKNIFLFFIFSFLCLSAGNEDPSQKDANARLSNVIIDTLKGYYARQQHFKSEMEALRMQVKATGVDPELAMPIMEEMRLSQEALKFLVYAIVSDKEKEEILSVVLQMKRGGI